MKKFPGSGRYVYQACDGKEGFKLLRRFVRSIKKMRLKKVEFAEEPSALKRSAEIVVPWEDPEEDEHEFSEENEEGFIADENDELEIDASEGGGELPDY